MKLLLTAALIALLLWLLYRRLRPYIQIVREIIGVVTGTLNVRGANSQTQLRRDGEKPESKLVRCAACETWTPQSRALQSGANFYCSSECLRKAPKLKRRRSAS